MGYSVDELIEMARALSEGDFEREFQQHFEGELGELAKYMDSLRHNLKSASATADHYSGFIPQASDAVADISRHTEVGVNSILELLDDLLADQEKVEGLLEKAAGCDGTIAELKEISRRTRKSLMSLMGYLSFQDVIRQRAEKVQEVIGSVEKKILELMLKLKIKTNQQVIHEGDGKKLLRDEAKHLSGDMGLDQSLVDELLSKLG